MDNYPEPGETNAERRDSHGPLRDSGSALSHRAVFFDLGGTLVHPAPSFHALAARVCREQGLPVTDEAARHAEAQVWKKVSQRPDGGAGFSVSIEVSRDFWSWVYRTLLEEMGYEAEARSTLPQQLLSTFLQPRNYELYDDVVPTLERLKAVGLVMGAITNWERWCEDLVVELKLDRYLAFAVISGVTGIEKPDPAMFRQALRESRVEARQAVHVGDSLRHDVEGAEATGIKGILLDREDLSLLAQRPVRHDAEPVTRIATLLELPTVLGL